MANNNNKTVAVSFGTGAFLVFSTVLAVLKLSGVIDISWLWVFMPLLMYVALVLGGLVVIAIFVGLLLLIAVATSLSTDRQVRQPLRRSPKRPGW